MKIYVDVLPRNEERKVNKETNSIKLEFGTHFEIDEICTTQSLKQQVREEVVEEIKNRLAEQRTKMQDDTHCYPQTVVCWQDIVAILERVKGENNDN